MPRNIYRTISATPFVIGSAGLIGRTQFKLTVTDNTRALLSKQACLTK